ncbi:MAG: zf-HC2 domain-containing protein [Endomicrobiaceae bacterium]|nr:zf-HC2 domain-containing protein [Endomicrobiaceae bacterium]
MKCKNIELMISLHIDNKLSLEEVTFLMEHLNSCEKCRQIYKDFKDIKIVLSDSQKTKVTNAFTDSTMKKIIDLQNKKNDNIIFVDFVKKHLIMVASFVFIIIASIVFLSKNSSDNSALAEYYLNYEQYSSVEDIYDENIISFLLLY